MAGSGAGAVSEAAEGGTIDDAGGSDALLDELAAEVAFGAILLPKLLKGAGSIDPDKSPGEDYFE